MSKKRYDNNTNVILDFGGRIPPWSNDIEQVVLGTMIADYELIGKYPYLKPEVFYNMANMTIFKALKQLYEEDKKPDLTILTDYLRVNSLLETVGGLDYIMDIAGKYSYSIDNYVKILRDKYAYREIIRFSLLAQKDSYEAIKDHIEIADNLMNDVMALSDFDMEVHNNFSKALSYTINNIKLSSKGQNISVIKSGHKMLDKAITFRSKHICIIAGPEGSGKTKFIISLVRGMLENEKNVAVEWFSMEDERQQIIRSFLAMDLKMTTKELQSINYQVNENDIQRIEEAAKHYERFNVEFYDRIASIATIVARCKRFGERYKNHKKVIIIDNLGLIECDKSGIERDDYLAAKIKDIADSNNACVFLVHHFTKEIARKANLEDGYRPRKEYLKGSTRILDFVQQALFVNLPRKYPDLLAEEKQIELNFIAKKDLPFTEENFDKYLWTINSQRDKDTQSLTDLRVETFVKVRSLINNELKDVLGEKITFSWLVQKYTEYSNHVDLKNKGRETKYMEKKLSIYSFIVKKMFNESYNVSLNNSRSSYLYGRNAKLKNHIDDLFIVESVKNRDDDSINDNMIFRYIADLGYNIFTEVPNDGLFGTK